MKIAIEGCAHGELEKIYSTIQMMENSEKVKIDLLICCGDFQATRNKDDLDTMAVPPKFRKMCSFHKYYTGEKIAPILTIFIGGNHEASNYLQELPYGGWAAPNIYYLGYAGVVNLGGLRIAGISGIYKPYDYIRGHFEKAPYTEKTKRSVYHVRNTEIFRLKQIKSHVDICLSHDWPRGVYNYGNVDELIKKKPFFRREISENTLGSQPCEELLFHLKPSYWFAAHLHCKFSALIPHSEKTDPLLQAEECDSTKFLALDKCLPKRKFLQVIEIPHNENEDLKLKYDLEWLTILHLSNHLTSVKPHANYLPGPGCNERWDFTPSEEEKDLILRKMSYNLDVPNNFLNENKTLSPKIGQNSNHQTTELCEKIGIDDPMTLFEDSLFSSPVTPERNDSSLTEDLSFVDSTNEKSLSFEEPDIEEVENTKSRVKLLDMILPSPKFNTSFGDDQYEKIETDPSKDIEVENSSTDHLFVIDTSPKRSHEEEDVYIHPKKTKLIRRNQQIYSNDNDE